MMSHRAVASVLWLGVVLIASCCYGDPELEDCFRIDAALTRGKNVYLFHNDQYLRLNNKLQEDRTGSIKLFGGLKSPIDAAVIWSGNKRTYFFRESQYYSYTMLIVGPYKTEAWDAEFTDGIDAAGNRDGKTYFFKRCAVVRMDTRKKVREETFDSGDLGLPCDVDAAFNTGNTLYVIKGNKAYKWDTAGVAGPYPLSEVVTLASWDICPSHD